MVVAENIFILGLPSPPPSLSPVVTEVSWKQACSHPCFLPNANTNANTNTNTNIYRWSPLLTSRLPPLIFQSLALDTTLLASLSVVLEDLRSFVFDDLLTSWRHLYTSGNWTYAGRRPTPKVFWILSIPLWHIYISFPLWNILRYSHVKYCTVIWLQNELLFRTNLGAAQKTLQAKEMKTRDINKNWRRRMRYIIINCAIKQHSATDTSAFHLRELEYKTGRRGIYL